MVSSKAFNRFRIDALKQIVRGADIKPPYHLQYRFEMKGKLDTDLDNMIAGINDILQEAEVLIDDKLILSLSAIKVPACKDWKTEITVYTYASNTSEIEKDYVSRHILQ